MIVIRWCTRQLALVSLFALMVIPSGCSEDNGLDLDNPKDPESESYVPTAPGDLVLTLADSGIVLNWKDRSHGEDGFIVERRIGGSGAFSMIAKTVANTTTYYDHMPLSTGSLYFYRVASTAKRGQGAVSQEAWMLFVFPLPDKPSLTVVNANSFRLDWFYADFIQQSFELEKSVNGGEFSVVATPPREARSYVDTDVDTLNDYAYRVTAISPFNESGHSQATHVTYAAVDAQIVRSVVLGRPVNSIVFSTDGSLLAAAGDSWALRVWRLSDGALVRDLNYKGSSGASGAHFPVAFNTDASLIASSGVFDFKASIWRLQDGVRVGLVPGQMDARSMCFSIDGTSIYTGGISGNVNQWNWSDGSLIRSLQTGISDNVTLLYIPRDGTRLIMCGGSPFGGSTLGIRILDINSLSLLASFNGFGSRYYSMSHDEQLVAAGSTVVSMVDGSPRVTFANFVSGQTCLSHDGKSLIGKDYYGAIKIGQVANGVVTFTRSIASPDIYTVPAIASSPNSNVFAAAGAVSGTIDLWLMKCEWRVY